MGVEHQWEPFEDRLSGAYTCVRCGAQVKRRFDHRLGSQRVIDMPRMYRLSPADPKSDGRWGPKEPPCKEGP